MLTHSPSTIPRALTRRVLGFHRDGVLNGIDVNDWNPATDPFLGAKYQGFDNFYSAADLSGKKGAKAHLQSCFHLPGTLSYLARSCCEKAVLTSVLAVPEDPNVPIIAFIGRLAYQVRLLCSAPTKCANYKLYKLCMTRITYPRKRRIRIPTSTASGVYSQAYVHTYNLIGWMGLARTNLRVSGPARKDSTSSNPCSRGL
eukprot:1688875-Rhodomonas_salina.1